MMQSVQLQAAENGIGRVTKIKLVVGKMTAALPAALEFAFAVLAKGTILAGARLDIEEKEVLVHCQTCGHDFRPGEIFCLVCPCCGSRATAIVEGKELCIAYFEGEEGESRESADG